MSFLFAQLTIVLKVIFQGWQTTVDDLRVFHHQF